MQVIEDDHVADLGQWILESSSAGQSDTALKQFATANTLFPAVGFSLMLALIKIPVLSNVIEVSIVLTDLVPDFQSLTNKTNKADKPVAC